MKEINELELPENILYAEDHEWALKKGDNVVIGISDYAQDQLGDITFVEMPEPGDSLDKGEEFGVVESTKAVSELYMPISGEVAAVNTALEDNPGLVNDKPYTDGWIIEVKPDDPSELDDLLGKQAYLEMLEGM